jgi:hypothetical protein
MIHFTACPRNTGNSTPPFSSLENFCWVRGDSMPYHLLTGAGFSANWGGWIASEAR